MLSGVDQLHEAIRKEVFGFGREAKVLDVGAGLASYHVWLKNQCRLTALDAHAPYLSEKRTDLEGVQRIVADAVTLMPQFRSTAFQAVLAIDFIEHLEKTVAIKLIGEMQRVGLKVCIFVPEGHHPQDTDAYGLGGDHWQTHRSEWHKEDLEALGFKVEVWEGFHALWRKDCDPNALWAVWSR
jgi:hypothetical protein